MLNQDLIKKEFGHLQKVHYLNSASKAIPPVSVQRAFHLFMDDYVASYGHQVKEKFQTTIDEARSELAKLINADPSEIAFTKNTSEGIGIIANGYPFKAGDNVILPSLEHCANKNVWVKKQADGLEVRLIPTVDWDIRIKDIEAAIDERTRAIAIASVEYTTGLRCDLKAVGELCRKHKLLLIVDAIQSVGRLDMDVKDLGIDFLSCGGHKGLQGTYGVGFIYCSSDLIRQIIPPYSAQQSAAFIDNQGTYSLDWLPDSRRVEGGNMNYAGIAALNEGAKLLNELGIAQIEAHILKLEQDFLKEVKGLPYIMRVPADPEKHSGTVCFEYPPEKKTALQGLFLERKIYVTFNQNYFRVSFGIFNTSEDVRAMAQAMRDALEDKS